MKNKQQLRQHLLSLRRALSPAAKQRASEQIRQRLLDTLAGHPHLNDAPLLIYRSLDDEVDTTALFETMPGRDIYAPVTHHAGEMHWRKVDGGTRWQRGDFGVLEPTSGDLWSIEHPAVLLCPLVGFDQAGNRLGMGKGCFDRWLDGVKNHILLGIGLAFACQQCPQIPVEEHDMPLDMIITEGESITCRNY